MTSLNVSLSDSAKAYVDEQVARGAYRTPDEYLAALIDADRQRQLRAELEEKLLAAARSPSTEMTREDWNDLRTVGRKLIAERKRT